MKKIASCLFPCMIFSFFGWGQCLIPNSFFPNDTMIVCHGATVQLDAPVITGAVYTWSVPDGGGSSVTINVNGKYWVQVDDGSCSKSDTVTVLFNSFLLSPEVSDLRLCKGGAIRALPVLGQNLLWYSDPVDGAGSNITPVPTTIDTGRVTHWVSQTIQGCESPRVPLMVRVIDKPKFDLGDAFIIPCGASGIILQVLGDGETNYSWNTGSNESSIIAPERGLYSLYAENECGNHRDSVVAVGCEDKCVQFPTAFTPNSDGINDRYQAACFCPVSKFKLVVYNRNGEIVFRTTDPKAGWNGYFKGMLQPNGVYIFQAEFYDFVLKESFTQKGTIALIR